MPSARIVSFSPRSEITAGFGPAGAAGSSSRTGTKPFLSSTTRTFLGVVGAGGGAAVRTQAARHAAQSTARVRRSGTEAPKLGESRPAATSKGRVAAIFAALVNLDALRLPGVRTAPLPQTELPPGGSAGLAVVLADDGSRYRLGFDG